MQALAKISTLGTAYTSDQVKTFLVDQQGQERWFFDLYDAGLRSKNDISQYIDYERTSPKITHDAEQVIQRSISFSLRGDAPIKQINSLSDVIGVRYQFRAPDGGWLEWQMGRFVIMPFDSDVFPGWSWYSLNCPDFGQLLTDDPFARTYTVKKGTNYVSAIVAIASAYGGKTPIKTAIQPSSLVLGSSLTFNLGTTRLQAINILLKAMNYFPAWFDEVGVLRSVHIPDYNKVNPSFVFDTTSGSSITMIPIQERPDSSKIYNRVVVIVEDSRKTVFAVAYENQNPNSPISTKNWHTKTLIVRDDTIPDSATGRARALHEAQAASRYYSRLIIKTFPWAVSQNKDVYRMIYSTSDEGYKSALVVEQRWEHTCRAGKPTEHLFQRILPT